MMAPAREHLPTGPGATSPEALVTATVAGQLFGIPIGRVHDVFNVEGVTPVPLAPADVVGLMNLRGRVITALDIRTRLGLAPQPVAAGAMAIGFCAGGDSFGLVVDQLGDVVTPEPGGPDETPIHLDPSWATLSRGIHRVADELLVVLDVDSLLASPAPQAPVQRRSEITP